MNEDIRTRITCIVNSGDITSAVKVERIMGLFMDNEKCTCNNFHEGNCTKSNFYEYEILEAKYLKAMEALKYYASEESFKYLPDNTKNLLFAGVGITVKAKQAIKEIKEIE